MKDWQNDPQAAKVSLFFQGPVHLHCMRNYDSL